MFYSENHDKIFNRYYMYKNICSRSNSLQQTAHYSAKNELIIDEFIFLAYCNVLTHK